MLLLLFSPLSRLSGLHFALRPEVVLEQLLGIGVGIVHVMSVAHAWAGRGTALLCFGM
jgi:hypothetical protein